MQLQEIATREYTNDVMTKSSQLTGIHAGVTDLLCLQPLLASASIYDQRREKRRKMISRMKWTGDESPEYADSVVAT